MIRVSVGLATAFAVALAVSGCQQPSSTPPAAAPAAEANAADTEPGVQLSALAPANIARVKAAGAAPFDLTGNWFIDTEGGQKPENWRFGPPYPTLTAEAQKRQGSGRGRAGGGGEGGRADSWLDRSLYDRCITRGVPGSMMPAIYGNSYQIQQGPGVVTITYEMVHDTRVIPLDNRPHVSAKIRQYLGDARGRWEGHTLVVETTNFNDKVPYRGSSDNLRIVERFTPIGPDTLEWSITFDDPRTWARPWTFAMNLTHDESQPPFEYACHEGNYGLRNILSAARAEDRQRAIAIEQQRPR